MSRSGTSEYQRRPFPYTTHENYNSLSVDVASRNCEFEIHTYQHPVYMQIAEEMKKLMGIAGPMAALNYVLYLRAMVSVLCLGQLGGLQLAGGTMSISFTNITGYAVLSGLASGMDPVCGQAYGCGNRAKLGRTLQRMILILLTACIPVSLLWINLESILLALGQNSSVTTVASVYCLFSLPDLLANSFLQPLKIYLKSQGLAAPMFWCSTLAIAIHVPVNVGLVFGLKLGVPGVAMAAVVTNFNTVLFVLGYLWYSGALQETWVPWSWACVREWWPLLKLGVPSCLGICLEWWWYEIITILAGYLSNPQVAIATSGVIIQTTALMYAFPHALGSSVSTRVGSELGAGRPGGAKTAAYVALGCAEVVAVVSLTWTIVLRDTWGKFFTKDQNVLALTAAVMPLVGVCELGNCLQTIGVGVLRGSARPSVGASINLGSFYFVGTPVAVALAFRSGLGFEGLWYGLLAAQIACAGLVSLVVLRTDWDAEAHKARELAGPSSEAILNTVKTYDTIVPLRYELVNPPDHRKLDLPSHLIDTC